MVHLSDRVYRMLLNAYPPRFRAEYGPHMAQVFRDTCRDASRQGGVMPVVALWLPLLLELITTAIQERIEEGLHMSLSSLGRWSSPLAMLAGVSLVVYAVLAGQLAPGIVGGPHRNADALTPFVAITFFSIALAGLGMYGLFAEQLGHIGKMGFALSLAGLVFGLIYTGGMLLRNVMGEPSWNWSVGAILCVMLFAPLLYGIAFLQPSGLPRWVGILLILAAIGVGFFNTEDNRVYWGIPIGLAWLGVGYGLWVASRTQGAGPTRLA
jgi:hypothetical protein